MSQNTFSPPANHAEAVYAWSNEAIDLAQDFTSAFPGEVTGGSSQENSAKIGVPRTKADQDAAELAASGISNEALGIIAENAAKYLKRTLGRDVLADFALINDKIDKLESEILLLKQTNQSLQSKNAALEARLRQQSDQVNTMTSKIDAMQSSIGNRDEASVKLVEEMRRQLENLKHLTDKELSMAGSQGGTEDLIARTNDTQTNMENIIRQLQTVPSNVAVTRSVVATQQDRARNMNRLFR